MYMYMYCCIDTCILGKKPVVDTAVRWQHSDEVGGPPCDNIQFARPPSSVPVTTVVCQTGSILAARQRGGSGRVSMVELNQGEWLKRITSTEQVSAELSV